MFDIANNNVLNIWLNYEASMFETNFLVSVSIF